MNNFELYDFAIALLAKRDYSSGELRRRLKREASNEESVEGVMERLLSHHYVDDHRLIERELNKQLNKGYGPNRIKQELRQKGLDSLLVEQAIEDLDVDWFELCLKVKEKKFADDAPQDAKEKAKVVRYLQYRGHSMNVIMDVLNG
ncbi:regulatory protein RecX [uncultured Vibrio sp.]|uniref:regulatory protein RecX n=1 Tax=uncultured Vibrio sp. TaxID=114054 RepID=UPI00261C3DBD|nr:regulatory protein RecX [uncultured Vibrio sp.]